MEFWLCFAPIFVAAIDCLPGGPHRIRTQRVLTAFRADRALDAAGATPKARVLAGLNETWDFYRLRGRAALDTRDFQPPLESIHYRFYVGFRGSRSPNWTDAITTGGISMDRFRNSWGGAITVRTGASLVGKIHDAHSAEERALCGSPSGQKSAAPGSGR